LPTAGSIVGGIGIDLNGIWSNVDYDAIDFRISSESDYAWAE